MKIKPKDIRVGDRITVTGAVVTVYGNGEVRAVLDGGHYTISIAQRELARAEITRPSRSLEVGDVVRFREYPLVYTIAHIIGGRAWIKPVGNGGDMVVHLSSLTRIEETADDAG